MILLLLACAPLPSGGDCEIDLSPHVNLEDGVDTKDPCYSTDPTTGVNDYSACCPFGYVALGLNAEGEVVCWCGAE